jgi:hypothetical protein
MSMSLNGPGFVENFIAEDAWPEPDLATTKNQCKNGGLEDFGFENQGDCVSFVATGGKNERGKSSSLPTALRRERRVSTILVICGRKG